MYNNLRIIYYSSNIFGKIRHWHPNWPSEPNFDSFYRDESLNQQPVYQFQLVFDAFSHIFSLATSWASYIKLQHFSFQWKLPPPQVGRGRSHSDPVSRTTGGWTRWLDQVVGPGGGTPLDQARAVHGLSMGCPWAVTFVYLILIGVFLIPSLSTWLQDEIRWVMRFLIEAKGAVEVVRQWIGGSLPPAKSGLGIFVCICMTQGALLHILLLHAVAYSWILHD